MLTLTLQGLVDLCWIAFGALGLVASRRLGLLHRHGPFWRIVGITFLLCGSGAFLQNAFGAHAFVSGPGSSSWNTYLAYAPALNHARTGAMIALFGLLLFGAYRTIATDRGFRRFVPLLLALGAVAGGFLGWKEETLTAEVHFWAVAVSDAGELVVALTMLFVALVRDRVDRLFWIALAIYAFKLALNVLWSSALTTIGFPWIWSPEPWQMNTYRVILAAAMLPFAFRRLQLANRGVDVPALFEPLQRTRIPVSTR